jgi:hypothetical protein
LNLDRSAAALLIALPIAFDTFFFLLGRLFDYPAVLRQPVGVVLSRFDAGGLRLKLTWYGFMRCSRRSPCSSARSSRATSSRSSR